MTLQTARLILRPITLEDAPAMFACSCGPEVGPAAGWKPHESPEETRQIIQEIFLDKEGIFGIVRREGGELIGSVGLTADPKRENERVRMLGYSLGREWWGCGYMTEAARAVVDYGFRTRELDLISAYCYPRNARSRRVLQKLGFIHEGTLRLCERLYTGEVLDDECYALLRVDWRGSPRQ